MTKETGKRRQRDISLIGEVEKGVPIPAHKGQSASMDALRDRLYNMEMGDSFYVPVEFASAEYVQGACQSIARKSREEEDGGFFVTTRTDRLGTRVWKTNI